MCFLRRAASSGQLYLAGQLPVVSLLGHLSNNVDGLDVVWGAGSVLDASH